jgi:hypothetical protein
MRRRTHSVRPYVDRLEDRTVPTSNLTVSFSAVTHTLTVVGDANADEVTVQGDKTSQTHFMLTSSGTINGQPSPFSTPTGVKNMAFKMLGGNAFVFFDPTVPVTVQGSVMFAGGSGQNTVDAAQLTVGKNLSVTNAAHNSSDTVELNDFSAGGNVTVRNAGGDSFTRLERNVAGVSTIKGSLTVTNGAGLDTLDLLDTNVDGSVTINNGHGNASGVAGSVSIVNEFNSAFRSVIGGNLTVSYLDGNSVFHDGIFDTEVLGNVTLNHGSGAFSTHMDGVGTQLPVLIHGSLTITGTGANSVEFGTRAGVGENGSGVVVDKGFTLTSGVGTAATLGFKNFRVGGNTSIKLGDGGNTVTIDDSEFGGLFTLVSGAGADTINLETTAGTSAATVFMKAVLIDLGAGFDTVNDVSNGSNTPDVGEALVIWSTFVYKNVENPFNALSHEYFPNGGRIQFE